MLRISKVVFAFAMTAGFGVACTSHPAANTPAPTAAASTDHREPSSVDTPESSMDRLEVSYREIMSSADPAKALEEYLSSLRKIYYRSEARLAAFDKALDAKAAAASGTYDLLDMPEYRAILIMRAVSERMVSKIEFVYKKLQFDAVNEQISDSNRAAAKKVLATMQKEINSKDDRKNVVYHDLRLALRGPAHEEHPKEQAHYIALVQKTRTEMQKLGAIEEQNSAGSTDHVNDEIIEEKTLLDQQAADNDHREPQSAGGLTGSGGWITGSTFPRGTWALTYDDGPHPTYTMKDVANLQAHGMKATFFWLAMNIIPYNHIVNEVRGAGFPTENHSYTHPILSSPKDLAKHHSSLQHEIVDSTAVDVKYYGEKPRFFRCPYGAGVHDPAVRGLLAQENLINVFWNVDSLDWQDHNPASILARVNKQMAAQGRGIILFHDIHPQSVEATRMLMDEARSKYNWVTIPEAVP